jgi:hypothetical protein
MRVGGVGSRNILGKKDHRCGKFGLKSPPGLDTRQPSDIKAATHPTNNNSKCLYPSKLRRSMTCIEPPYATLVHRLVQSTSIHQTIKSIMDKANQNRGHDREEDNVSTRVAGYVLRVEV